MYISVIIFCGMIGMTFAFCICIWVYTVFIIEPKARKIEKQFSNLLDVIAIWQRQSINSNAKKILEEVISKT